MNWHRFILFHYTGFISQLLCYNEQSFIHFVEVKLSSSKIINSPLHLQTVSSKTLTNVSLINKAFLVMFGLAPRSHCLLIWCSCRMWVSTVGITEGQIHLLGQRGGSQDTVALMRSTSFFLTGRWIFNRKNKDSYGGKHHLRQIEEREREKEQCLFYHQQHTFVTQVCCVSVWIIGAPPRLDRVKIFPPAQPAKANISSMLTSEKLLGKYLLRKNIILISFMRQYRHTGHWWLLSRKHRSILNNQQTG